MLRFALPPPSPRGALTIHVVCRSSSERGQHDVVLHQDWSVSTPHDLEAERVSLALGGSCSCIELVEVVVPAAKVWLRRNLRHDLLPMTMHDEGSWAPSSPIECCRSGTVTEVADHLRSAVHLGRVPRLREPINLVRITGALRRIHLPMPTEDVEPLVGLAASSVADLVTLWKAGLHPEWVATAHALVGATRPLSPDFYLAVLVNDPDPAWLRSTARGDEGLLTWLAKTVQPVDRAVAERRRRWLDLGLDREVIEVLNGSRYEPADVQLLAARRGRTVGSAAGLLGSLTTAGVQPPLPLVLASVGAAGRPVQRRDLTDLAQRLALRGVRVSAEEAAGALLRCGSVSVALEVVAAVGSAEPRAVAEGLSAWRRGQSTARRRGHGSMA